MSHKSTPGSEPVYDTRTLGLPEMPVLGLQHLFAMFGAIVLIPTLVQGYGPPLSIQTTLSFTGIDTLFFHTCTRLRAPVFLDSSLTYLGGFSVVAALGFGAYATMEPSVKLQYVCGGIVVAGSLYVILAVIIKLVGVKKVMCFLPPVVTGSVIILIGLSLAPNAASNASLCRWLVLLSTAVIVTTDIRRKGMVKTIPILLGVAAPYLVAVVVNVLGATVMDASGSVTPLMDFSAVAAVALIDLQPFSTDFTGSIARFDATFILVMAFIAMAVMMEYIGDMSVISATVSENFLERSGLHRTLIGDGVATSLTGLFGDPASTTHGENIDVLVLSRVYDPKAVRLAAVYAVVLFFSPASAALVNSIPTAIIDGVFSVLCGMISTIGMRNVAGNRMDFTNSRNLTIAAAILVRGLGFSSGVTFPVGGAHVTLTNLAITAIMGIALNAILPGKDYEFGFDVTEGRSGNLGCR